VTTLTHDVVIWVLVVLKCELGTVREYVNIILRVYTKSGAEVI
jgi:hypothetical protein